ncbi:MAG: SDR family NAD(P)-dependent oxidoreductase [Actinomycetota bacterium]
MDVAGHGVLVTGAASGLGAATAADFAEQGADVTGLDRAGTPPVDVTDAEAVQTVIGGVDDLRVLVCCAGTGGAGGLTVRRGQPHDLAAFEQTVRINLVGTFNCVRLAAAAMADLDALDGGERGVIVMTASIAATDGVTGGVAYSASKSGVAGMTLPLARDLGHLGIRVVTIAPGPMDTPMAAGLPRAYFDQLIADTPFPPRLGAPAEFARLARHIVENPMLNGDVIRIDGGLRMRAPDR